ncbi:MAG: tyrosine-type recombinase/integrase [Desulfobulbus sp.]
MHGNCIELQCWLRLKKSQVIEFGRWVNYIKPVLGDKSINEITKFDYLLLRRHLESNGLSPQTVYHCLSLLRRVLNRACEWKGDDFSIPNFKNIMPKFDNRRQRYLDNEEVKIIFDSIKKIDNSGNWYDISLFAINTGLRRGEIFNIVLTNVNFSDKTVMVVDTKSNRNRIVPLNDIAYSILSKKRDTLKSKYSNIFCDKNPRLFRKAIENSGVNNGVVDLRDKVVFHTFRHTFASWLVQGGVPLALVGQLLGHSSIYVTMRYAHLSISQAIEAVDLINCRIKHIY